MFAVSVKVAGPGTATVSEVFNQIKDKQGFLLVIGNRGAETLKRHYRTLDQVKPNKMGGARTHFWRQVADSVGRPIVVGSSAIIPIGHPVIAHKAGVGPAGGTIVPKLKQWLAYPAPWAVEAYGMSPKEYEDETGNKLTFLKKNSDKAYLAVITVVRTEFDDPNDQSKHRDKETKINVIFLLRKRVFQKPDPEALPGESTWKTVLEDESRKYLDRVTGR